MTGQNANKNNPYSLETLDTYTNRLSIPAYLFACVLFNNPVYIGDIEGCVAAPLTVFSEGIYGFYPFGEGTAFFPNKGTILSFGF
jgi:hypothetical protein